MRVAVACDGLEIAPRFKQSSSYMCYTVTYGVITSSANTPIVEKIGSGVLALLKSLEVDVLIAGTVNEETKRQIQEAGIELVDGKSGSSVSALMAYISDTFGGGDDDFEDDDSLDNENDYQKLEDIVLG